MLEKAMVLHMHLHKYHRVGMDNTFLAGKYLWGKKMCPQYW